MDKRLLLAIGLSLLVMMSWSALISRLYPVEKKEVVTIEPQPSSQIILPVIETLPEEKVVIGSEEVSFILPYAAIKEVVFKDYQHYRFQLSQGFLWAGKDLVFQKERLQPTAYFTYADPEKRVTKKFTFRNSNYTIDLNITIQNLKPSPLQVNSSLVLAKLDLKTETLEQRFQEVVLGQKDKIVRLNWRRPFDSTEDVKFLALRGHYFCAIVEPQLSGFKGFIHKIGPKEIELGLNYQGNIEPQGVKELNFLIYLGPQKLQALSATRQEWQAIVYYGAFDGMSKLLLKLLKFLQTLVHNWGLAIVLLSICIYFILYPLTLKQMRSMKKMQELQPKIEQIRQSYKDNPQKVNKEILELYRQEKVNPAGGCLPLLLQIPIFFALYQALMRSLDLKGARFLWIKDLSEPDKLFVLSQNLPFIGRDINLLPLLMLVLMVLQQKTSQVKMASATEQQRLMNIIFPIMFGFIFYHMPSGLVLYWFMNSLLMVLYQFRIKFNKV